jgi:anti-sigma B factor antagonist
MSLSYGIEDRGGVAAVHLTGRIDRDAAAAFDTLAAAVVDATGVELDFRDVDYINSTGIALIVGLLARARNRHVPVAAMGLTSHYRHIFEITRLDDFIDVVQPAEH